MPWTLISSNETSEKFLSVGRERKEHGSVPSMQPWAMAQLLGCMAQVVLPGTKLIMPGITTGDRGPSPRPITQTQTSEPTASKMAHRRPLSRGIKDLSCKTSYFSVVSTNVPTDGRPAVGKSWF